MMSTFRSCGLGVVGLAWAGLSTSAPAVDLAWVNPDGGLFGDLANWDPNVVPGALDNVLFDLSSSTPYTVEFEQSRSSRLATVDSDEVLLALGGLTWTVRGLALGDGFGNDGDLFVTDGTLALVAGDPLFARIGKDLGAIGRLQVESDGTFSTAQDLIVGDAGTGLLEVCGTVSAGDITLLGDDAGADGTIIIDGVGASLTLGGETFVGNAGSGEIVILVGAADTTRVKIADEAGSIGNVVVDGAGSTWNDTVEIFVGNFGTGTLTVSNGGTVSGVAGTIADDPGSVGIATVTGAGSSWSSSGTLEVGDLGSGTLRVIDGGQVSVDGNYTQSGSSELEVVIGPASAGTMIDVGGSASLGGTLTVSLQAGHDPPGGTMYTVMTAGGVSGGFGTIDAGAGLEVDVTGTTVTVTVTGGGGVPGDVTGDGIVNVQDLIAIITAWGTADPDADLDDDGIVGVDDLVLVIVNWG